MKINEKHLCAFATSNATVDKQGYLLKRGETNQAFQRRWFTLKGNLLFYSEKHCDREPVGVIILEDCSVEVSETEVEASYAFELSFNTAAAPGIASRTYILAASSQEEMEDWMRSISCANYSYARHMVIELQAELDALAGTDLPAKEQKKFGATPSKENCAKIMQAQPRQDLLVDFDVVPPVSLPTRTRGGVGHVRNFEEMHEDFGRRIQECVSGGAAYFNP